MVQDAVELVEAVDGGQVFVAVAQVVLADLRRSVAVGLEQLGDRRIGILQSLFGGRHADLQKSLCAEWSLAGDERGTPGRTGLLTVVVSEQAAFFGDPVDVGRRPAHHAAVVGAEVPGAHVVGHDHDDVRLLLIWHWVSTFVAQVTGRIGRETDATLPTWAGAAGRGSPVQGLLPGCA